MITNTTGSALGAKTKTQMRHLLLKMKIRETQSQIQMALFWEKKLQYKKDPSISLLLVHSLKPNTKGNLFVCLTKFHNLNSDKVLFCNLNLVKCSGTTFRINHSVSFFMRTEKFISQF